MNKSADEVSRAQLIADFKAVVADAESLLKETADLGGEELHAVRARAEESLQVVKARIASEQEAFIARTRELADAADAYVHEKPWTAIGLAAAAGLALGLLSRR